MGTHVITGLDFNGETNLRFETIQMRGPVGPVGPQGPEGPPGPSDGPPGPGVNGVGEAAQILRKRNTSGTLEHPDPDYETDWVPLEAANVQGLDTAITTNIAATTVDVPAHLTTFIPAPPTIKANGAPWDIHAFGTGEAQRGLAVASRNYYDAFSKAAVSGEMVELPNWEMPWREQHRIDLTSDAPINWRGSGSGSRIIVGKELKLLPAGNSPTQREGGLFKINPSADVSLDNLISVAFRDIHFDAREITADTTITPVPPAINGKGVNPGISFFDLFNCKPTFENCIFNGSYTPNLAEQDVGHGWMDQLVSGHDCLMERYVGCLFIGAGDSAIYTNGKLNVVALADDPITITTIVTGPPSSTTATFALASADTKLKVGDPVTINGATALNGISFSGGYAVTAVMATTFTVVHPAAATATGTGGGTNVNCTLPRQDVLASLPGVGALIDNCRFYRCSNAITIKRQMSDVTIRHMRAIECTNAIMGGNAGNTDTAGETDAKTPNLGVQGKRIIIEDFKAKRIIGRPIALYGSPFVSIRNAEIEDFGSWLYDNGLTPSAAADPIAAVDLQSCPDWRIDNLQVRQTGNYATRCIGLKVQKSAEYPYTSTKGKGFRMRGENLGRGIRELVDADFNEYEMLAVNNANPHSIVGHGSGLIDGTYTPTFVLVTNLTAASALSAAYLRQGNTVRVSGALSITPTVGTTAIELGISLPISSALTLNTQVAGTATAQTNTPSVFYIRGDAANDRAAMIGIPNFTVATAVYFDISYVVI